MHVMNEDGALPQRLAINPFYVQLALEGVPLRSIATLDSTGARDAFTALGVLSSFPTLTEHGLLNAAELSHAIASLDGEALARFSASAEGAGVESERAFGASAPPDAYWQDAEVVPIDEGGTIDTPLMHEAGAVDLRQCGPWPVADQGQRGSCVAFAAVALRELQDCREQGQIVDLSEQYLYWVVKTATEDPRRDADGTWLNFALDALRSHGVCTEAKWPYDRQPIPDNPGHAGIGAPSTAALHEALNRRIQSGTHENLAGRSGNAAPILAALRAGKPVAISVPVFWDPTSQQNNWSMATSWSHGFVADPPPTSVVRGGHAICLVGFTPDSREPMGGYFVLRNSWSTGWGRALPAPGYVAPEPGYGQISMTYVDKYLWEYLTF